MGNLTATRNVHTEFTAKLRVWIVMKASLINRHISKAALLIGLSFGLAVPALAHADRNQSGSVFGSVVSGSCQGNSSFMVATPSGSSLTVQTNKRTVCVPNSSAAVIAGFAKGDAVLVREKAGKGRVAVMVTYDTIPFALPAAAHTYSGRYSGSGSDSVTVDLPKGAQVTFVVDSSTVFIENGKAVSSPTYATGDVVTAHCHEFTDGREWATLVSIRGHHKK